MTNTVILRSVKTNLDPIHSVEAMIFFLHTRKQYGSIYNKVDRRKNPKAKQIKNLGLNIEQIEIRASIGHIRPYLVWSSWIWTAWYRRWHRSSASGPVSNRHRMEPATDSPHMSNTPAMPDAELSTIMTDESGIFTFISTLFTFILT